jgi:hypothetical protein
MAKKTRTELSTLALNTNLPDNTTELITPTTERAQLTDERESVVNYKDDLGGVPNAGKFLTVAVDGESLTMVDEPSGVPNWVTFQTAVNNLMMLASGGTSAQLRFYDTDGTTIGATISWADANSKLLIGNSQTLEEISLSGNQISLSLGGLPHLTILSGGNVGIGTTTPLTINGNAVAGSGLHVNASSGYGVSVLDGADGCQMFFNDRGTSVNSRLWRLLCNDGSFSINAMNDDISVKSSALTISSGGLATFSNGIKFGGTPSPAYDVAATTLDAYEEGTWTGTQVNDGVGLSSTGSYTRIGNTVFFKIYIGGTTTSAGLASVTGLPYSASSSNGYNIFSYVHGSSLANSRGGYISGTTLIPLTNGGTGGVDWVVGSVISMFSGTYTI